MLGKLQPLPPPLDRPNSSLRQENGGAEGGKTAGMLPRRPHSFTARTLRPQLNDEARPSILKKTKSVTIICAETFRDKKDAHQRLAIDMLAPATRSENCEADSPPSESGTDTTSTTIPR